MSSRDACAQCETNYVLQDDARCGICAECEAVLDEESDGRTKARAVEFAFDKVSISEASSRFSPQEVALILVPSKRDNNE